MFIPTTVQLHTRRELTDVYGQIHQFYVTSFNQRTYGAA